MKQFSRINTPGIKTIAALLQKALALGAALIVLSGSSVWEGAAALAPRGELPEDGYYAATNSFPRNTVVDITNLETGKSVRAVVSSGLNSPGLLAILSADTANRIGLSAKTIGRIRMTQPEDPIAFSRFTEGLVFSGDPDYDPAAMIAGDAREMAEAEKTPLSQDSREIESSTAKAETPAYEYNIPEGIEYAERVDYSQGSIVDLRSNSSPPPPQDSWIPGGRESGWDEWDYSLYPPEDESVENTNYRIWERGGAVGQVTAPAPPQTVVPPPGSPDPWADVWKAGETPPKAESAAPAPPSGNYTLIPTEERPPAETPGPRKPQIPPPDEKLDESLFIDSIEKQRELKAAEAARIAEAVQAAEAGRAAEAARLAEAARTVGIVEAEELPGPWVEPLESISPARQPEKPAPILTEKDPPPAAPPPRQGPPDPVQGVFSLPVKVITELEQGKYYVQIGAYRNVASVESALLKLDPGYPLNVQNGGTADNPTYRLLVGPLNLGESGALVQRFKGSGYRDAYIRNR
ncbi:MAG: SPOR domain-containing protein [Treponema sp.]|jgi:hypothetical protein|nr:SPOR domain-containing protein [Treponema sp.]